MDGLSLYTCVISAAEHLHLSNTDEFAWLTKIGNDGARKIGCWETLIQKPYCIDIDCNGRGCLPSGFYQMLAIRVKRSPNIQNPEITMTPPGMGYLCYLNLPVFKSCGINTGGWCGTSSSYQVMGNTLQMFGLTDCMVEIVYMGYNTNEHGHMVVLPEWEEALMWWLCYNYALAYQFPIPYMSEYKRNWTAAVRKIKGDSQLRQLQLQKVKIASIMNSFVLLR
jgi:hypothetical protein